MSFFTFYKRAWSLSVATLLKKEVSFLRNGNHFTFPGMQLEGAHWKLASKGVEVTQMKNYTKDIIMRENNV